MVNEVIDIEIPAFFSHKSLDQDQNVTRIIGASRQYYKHDDFDVLLDKLSESIYCMFLRAAPKDHVASYRFNIQGKFEIKSITSGGWVVYDKFNSTSPRYWIPTLPINRKSDEDAHILEEDSAELIGLVTSQNNLSVTINGRRQHHLDLIIFEFRPDAYHILDELLLLEKPETNAIFLWGSHTKYTKPADLFLHLIHGFIYENRTAWPYYRKICSENDAHALYVTLTGLQQATGKEIYKSLKSQIILSVISRQGDDGAWRHGEWSNDMESHFRLHCSGMHLLMDALSMKYDAYIEQSLKKAASFISKQYDKTQIGTWFLHDELELTEGSMRKSPFKWVRSKAFGKQISNMLVFNTHLDITIALDRYSNITGDQQYGQSVLSARHAASAIFDTKPAELIYKCIFRAIRLTLLPTNQASQLPVTARIIKRIGWKYLIPNLQRIKRVLPRINMPGGYIDRALTLKGISPAYQNINLMDLTRYMHRFPNDIPLSQINEALEFSQQSTFREYLLEKKETEYALGFWGEALYHLCIMDKNEIYRAWIAEAIIDLKREELGLPPSILGGNMEALTSPTDTSCPYDYQSSVIMVNLSTPKNAEFLLVNTDSSPQSIKLKYPCLVRVSGNLENAPGTIDKQIYFQPGGWLSIRPA